MIPVIEIKTRNNTLPKIGSIPVRVAVKSFLDDSCTPVSLYLRLRDQYPGAVLLESAENAEGKNARSFIAVKPVAEIVCNHGIIRISVPSCQLHLDINSETANVPELLNEFLSLFKISGIVPEAAITGLIGYMNYDSVKYFDDVELENRFEKNTIPDFRYSLYSSIIVFDHLLHRMHLVEQLLPGDESDTSRIESLIHRMDTPQFRFETNGDEKVNCTDEQFLFNVEQAKNHCRIGDVFQLVLSRQYKQKFSGDEFNVYRALRAINPSPYLFFADFGDYKLFGSSPEAQLIVQEGRATLHPIAGTFRRSGDARMDLLLEEKLLKDPKENAEHIMLVDLARNDLSRTASDVKVDAFREVHRFSHVIHLVSKVSGKLKPFTNLFRLLGNTFPAGTLSGAPKLKAIELIDKYETTARGFYGGCIGLVGFDGTMNQAIMIRSFLSKNGELTFQAGAGIVVSSKSENELQEITNKLQALRSALDLAKTI